MRALLLLAVFLVPATGFAQATRDSLISVNLTRMVRLAPDRASWFLTIEGTAETTQAALALADTKLTAVVRALRALGSGVELGTPVSFAVGPTPGARGFPGAPTITTVTARSAMRVRVLRIADLARTLAAATEAGAAGASTVTFESDAADSARIAEVGVALAMARREAQIIAQTLDGTLGGLVDVSTMSNDRMFVQPTMLPMEGMGQQTSAPEVSITVTLNARFRLVRERP